MSKLDRFADFLAWFLDAWFNMELYGTVVLVYSTLALWFLIGMII